MRLLTEWGICPCRPRAPEHAMAWGSASSLLSRPAQPDLGRRAHGAKPAALHGGRWPSPGARPERLPLVSVHGPARGATCLVSGRRARRGPREGFTTEWEEEESQRERQRSPEGGPCAGASPSEGPPSEVAHEGGPGARGPLWPSPVLVTQMPDTTGGFLLALGQNSKMLGGTPLWGGCCPSPMLGVEEEPAHSRGPGRSRLEAVPRQGTRPSRLFCVRNQKRRRNSVSAQRISASLL